MSSFDEMVDVVASEKLNLYFICGIISRVRQRLQHYATNNGCEDRK
jgi:predicted DNA-binding protein (UPF0278 family)